MTQVIAVISAAVLLASSFAGCRSPRKAVRVGGDAATLKVTMTNLPAADTNRTDWVYELSGCISAIYGNLSAPTEVEFSAVGLKNGLTGCQLKVKTLGQTSGMTFQAEPGTLYWNREIVVSENADGALVAVANLQPLYTPTGPTAAIFTLQVPVKFAAAEPGVAITAGIQCTPDLLSTGLFERSGADAGMFTFKTEISAEASYHCTEVSVRVDGSAEARHKGTFAGETGKFTARRSETFKSEVLSLVKIETRDPGKAEGVDVNTKGENCNEEGKVYNPATRKCESK